jgi:IclR family acetate operon transcriptional repressor
LAYLTNVLGIWNRPRKPVTLNAITPNTITGADAPRRALARIREQGEALSKDEHNPDLGTMSVPLFNHRGMLSGVLSLAIPEIR